MSSFNGHRSNPNLRYRPKKIWFCRRPFILALACSAVGYTICASEVHVARTTDSNISNSKPTDLKTTDSKTTSSNTTNTNTTDSNTNESKRADSNTSDNTIVIRFIFGKDTDKADDASDGESKPRYRNLTKLEHKFVFWLCYAALALLFTSLYCMCDELSDPPNRIQRHRRQDKDPGSGYAGPVFEIGVLSIGLSWCFASSQRVEVGEEELEWARSVPKNEPVVEPTPQIEAPEEFGGLTEGERKEEMLLLEKGSGRWADKDWERYSELSEKKSQRHLRNMIRKLEPEGK